MSQFMRWGIVTRIAFVWLFSAVCFQMPPQIARLYGCKVTLVAFVWFFSLFLQDFLTLQPKVIILTNLFHCVAFCPNGPFKLIQINDWLRVKNHNLTFPRHTFTFDEYKENDTISPKKNVLMFNLRIISTHVEVILSNSSYNLLFPLQRCWAKIIIFIIDITYTCWV